MTHSHKQTGWEISEVRTVDGEFMVCGGEGHSFGLIATVTREEDARLIAATHDLYEAVKSALKVLLDEAEERNFDPPANPILVANLEYALSKARPTQEGA